MLPSNRPISMRVEKRGERRDEKNKLMTCIAQKVILVVRGEEGEEDGETLSLTGDILYPFPAPLSMCASF